MSYARPLLGGTRLLHERLQAHGRQVELTTPHQTHAFRRRGRVGCLCQGCEVLAFGLGEGAFAEPRNELAAVRERGLPTYGCERGGARSQRSAVRVPSEIHIAEAAWWRCQGGEGAEGVKGGMVGTEKGRGARGALIVHCGVEGPRTASTPRRCSGCSECALARTRRQRPARAHRPTARPGRSPWPTRDRATPTRTSF